MNHQSSHHGTVPFGAVKIARSAIVGLALLGAAYVDAGGVLDSAALRAQSIINNAGAAGNIAGKSFSDDDALIARGGFDPGALQRLKLTAPTSKSSVIDSAEYRFPFKFPTGAGAQNVTAIDLLCSPDRGATWYSYSSVLSNDGRRQFLFEAPEPGEYWFALMTSFDSGKRTFSSTRTMTFTAGVGLQNDSFAVAKDAGHADASPQENSFALTDDAGDAEDEFSVPSLGAPTSAGHGDSLAELGDIDAPSLLPQTFDSDEDSLLINNASYAGEDAMPAEPMPQAPQTSGADLDAPNAASAPTPNVSSGPWPGKFKNLSFGTGKGSNQLMVTVRWFRPEDLDSQYQIGIRSLSIERAPTQAGPWTIVAEDLDVNQSGYSWTATAEEMKPFFVRSVARDMEGNVWRDVTTSAMDVNLPAVRSALGPVKTPVPFDDDKAKAGAKAKADEEEIEEASKATEKMKLIRHTASEDEESEAADDDEEEPPKAKSPLRLVSTVERGQSGSAAARRERPNIPPPTNPNEFQINPLFTQGFSVLYQSSQARMEPVSTQKRSIFTPPTRAQRERYVRPAEHRLSQQQINAQRIEQERKAYEERLKYNKEHEMETFAQKPELMQGRMFYMDSNGNLTTTPPAEMQQALAFGNNMEAMGWTQADGTVAAQNAAATSGMTVGSGDQSLYMPKDAEAYDSSARSGAAIWNNTSYPQASNPGASPLNNRYSDGNTTIDSTIPAAQNAAPIGTNPQTYYAPSTYSPSAYSTSPYYVSNAASASEANYAFPPRPNVAQ